MRIPLVRSLGPSESATKSFPATNAQAEIVLSESDGENIIEVFVDKVESRDFFPGRSEINFWLDGIAPNSWKVTITEQRVIVWNPASKGLIGKAKVKSGHSSGGHLNYRSITNLSTFIDGGKAVLLVVCTRPQKIRSAISICGDFQSMRNILIPLYKSLDHWLVESNNKLPDDSNDERHQKTLSAWKEFLEKAWNPEFKEVSVVIPSQSFDIVADGRSTE